MFPFLLLEQFKQLKATTPEGWSASAAVRLPQKDQFIISSTSL